jgi:hypothetical protein
MTPAARTERRQASSSRISPASPCPSTRDRVFDPLSDVVVPDDPADVVTLIDGVYDQPSTIDDQVRWLAAAGFNAEGVWAPQDPCVIVADSPF